MELQRAKAVAEGKIIGEPALCRLWGCSGRCCALGAFIYNDPAWSYAELEAWNTRALSSRDRRP